MSRLNTLSVLSDEYDILNEKLKQLQIEKDEIAQLWKDANLQWSETFGHDNPILESKHEKSMLLSIQMPKFIEIEKQLSSCLITTEEEVIKRKQQDLENFGNISIGIWSIIKIKIEWAIQESELLVAWITQGTKINFMWKKYSTICESSPIRSAIVWKYPGDKWSFLQSWKSKWVSIIDIQ